MLRQELTPPSSQHILTSV